MSCTQLIFFYLKTTEPHIKITHYSWTTHKNIITIIFLFNFFSIPEIHRGNVDFRCLRIPSDLLELLTGYQVVLPGVLVDHLLLCDGSQQGIVIWKVQAATLDRLQVLWSFDDRPGMKTNLFCLEAAFRS